MVVPNYIPEPVEISDNVTLRPYGERVSFIRRVLSLHFLSLGVIAGLSAVHTEGLVLASAGILVAVCLVVLSLIRIETRGTRIDLVLSSALLPVLLIGLAMVVRGLVERGVPLWAPPIGTLCGLIYAYSCGRDFSWVGQWFLAMVASNVAIATIVNFAGLDPRHASQGILLNSLYLTYTTYDSAALMARRRIGEEIAAVVDLYRDVLNIFGYAVRCVRHWRMHKIWNLR